MTFHAADASRLITTCGETKYANDCGQFSNVLMFTARTLDEFRDAVQEGFPKRGEKTLPREAPQGLVWRVKADWRYATLTLGRYRVHVFPSFRLLAMGTNSTAAPDRERHYTRIHARYLVAIELVVET